MTTRRNARRNAAAAAQTEQTDAETLRALLAVFNTLSFVAGHRPTI